MLSQLLAAATAAGTIHGFRQALEQTAANLRQQAAAWRQAAATSCSTSPPPFGWLRDRAHRAEVNRWAGKLEQIATALEAEAKRREREEIAHQHGASALMTSVQQQLAAGLLSRVKRAIGALRGR